MNVVKNQLYFYIIWTFPLREKRALAIAKTMLHFQSLVLLIFLLQFACFGLPLCRKVYKASTPKSQIQREGLMGRNWVMLGNANGEWRRSWKLFLRVSELLKRPIVKNLLEVKLRCIWKIMPINLKIHLKSLVFVRLREVAWSNLS